MRKLLQEQYLLQHQCCSPNLYAHNASMGRFTWTFPFTYGSPRRQEAWSDPEYIDLESETGSTVQPQSYSVLGKLFVLNICFSSSAMICIPPAPHIKWRSTERIALPLSDVCFLDYIWRVSTLSSSAHTLYSKRSCQPTM